MKNKICALVLAISLTLSVLAPRRSEALVGAVIAAPVVVTVGAVTACTGGGVIGASFVVDLLTRDSGRVMPFLTVFLVGAAILGLGLVVLDDQSHSVQFAPLDQGQIEKLGITTEQALAYNSELDEINVIKQTIETEVAKSANPSVEQAHARWVELGAGISPNAFAALEKVSAEFVKNLQTQE